MASIVRALKVNVTITSLDLSGNPFNGVEVQQVIASLQRNKLSVLVLTVWPDWQGDIICKFMTGNICAHVQRSQLLSSSAGMCTDVAGLKHLVAEQLRYHGNIRLWRCDGRLLADCDIVDDVMS